MRRKFAVLSMITAHSLKQVFWVLLLLVLGNGLIFRLFPMPEGQLYEKLDSGAMVFCWILSYGLISFFLIRALCDRGGNQDLMIRRLELSPKRFFWIHCLYNSCCYFLLYAVESLSLMMLARWHIAENPGMFTSQSWMLVCYQSDVLHSFLPLSDGLGWAVNAFAVTGMGICAAAFSFRNRGGKLGVSTFFMAALIPLYVVLQNSLHGMDITAKILFLILGTAYVSASLWGVGGMEEVYAN